MLDRDELIIAVLRDRLFKKNLSPLEIDEVLQEAFDNAHQRFEEFMAICNIGLYAKLRRKISILP